jgi:TPR repeat protein
MRFFGLSFRGGSGTRRTDDACAEEQVTAMRSALAHCRQLTMRYQRMYRAALAALVVAIVAVAFVNREALMRAMVDLPVVLRLKEPAVGIDAAYAAYRKRDGETALRLARTLADKGDARAQTLLALIHYDGVGVPRDDGEATKWFRRAADSGNGTAQFHLGVMYAEGRGVPQNFAQAEKWYLTAAEQNFPQAQYNLGIMYLNGWGVPQDNLKAHMWFNLAAANFPATDLANRNAAARNRDAIAKKMTADELAQAQKLAREWNPR